MKATGPILILTLLIMVPPAIARPKLVATGRCSCVCSGPNLFVGREYDSLGNTCDAFDGKTCNVEDPATGGVRSGRLLGCASEMKLEEGASRPSIAPKDLPELQQTEPPPTKPDFRPSDGMIQPR
jgi:hypothetical protein